ncbi:MAG: penicillin-binding protein activator LpoB [Calditrichae bacterium]|nr:penicillin-binding protein activator LpoB [Calditrichota bacterium]MCB9057829.1 penicillin-binding protein activator LpoB [Calditrichia bacterium]
MSRILIAVFSLFLFLTACSTTREVKRIDAGSQTDLSGRWNDTDSRLVATEMVNDGLSRIWLTNFVEQNGKKPVIIVGLVKNKTHELISAETFIKDIEREFVNSGKVSIVQGAEARDELRSERADQQEFASAETAKKWGKEKGADFILQGVINSLVDKEGDDKVVFYQVDLELTDLETNEKVWLGNKKIKKFITN